jgi:hypothetical protein
VVEKDTAAQPKLTEGRAAFWLHLAVAAAAVWLPSSHAPPIFFKSLFDLRMINFTVGCGI